MIGYSVQNKKAWEYNTCDFWVQQAGMSAQRTETVDIKKCCKKAAQSEQAHLEECFAFFPG